MLNSNVKVSDRSQVLKPRFDQISFSQPNLFILVIISVKCEKAKLKKYGLTQLRKLTEPSDQVLFDL